MLSAVELHARGLRAANAGRHARAKADFERALARSPDAEISARCLLSSAHIAAELGSQQEGLELCEAALGYAAQESSLAGLAHSQMGLLHMRTGDETQALQAFARALPLLADEPAALARLHLNRGNIHLQNNRPAAAVLDFQDSSSTALDPIEAAKAEHNLGYAEFLRGNLVEALSLMERAAVVLAPLSPVSRAVGAADRAEVLSACGLTEQAGLALEQAAHAFALRKLRQSQAEAELARARILLARDPGTARALARTAARRFRLRGSQDWALRAEVVSVGAEVALSRRTAVKAAADLHAALVERRIRAEAKTTCLYAATAALDRGDAESATHWLKRSGVAQGDPLETRLLDRLTRARLAGGSGLDKEAFSHLREGLDDLHEWLSEFGSLDLQSSLVGRGRGLAAYGLEMAVRDGRPELVFEWFERARVLVSRVTPVKSGSAEEGDADLAELRRRQSTGEDTEELKTRIRQRAWYAPSIGRSAHPATLAKVQASLGSDALLSLTLTDGELTALTMTSTQVKVIPLGSHTPVSQILPTLSADLDMGASQLPAPIASAVRASLDERLNTLSELLIAPVLGSLGTGRLVIVPAGALAGVPWTLLPSLRGRAVTVSRSATHWLAGIDHKPLLSSAGFVTGPGVPRAAEEVRRAATGWGTATRIAIDGSADEVSQLAGSVDVLHVAAHGRHSADNPLFSGIELTGGPWFGYDIDQLPHVPSVVLLSACELGRSTVRGAEELVGMTTAWLHAGTRCVIASPAAVNDDVAAELLPLVHERLAAGEPPAEALAKAMMQVDGLAAFACYGSGW